METVDKKFDAALAKIEKMRAEAEAEKDWAMAMLRQVDPEGAAVMDAIKKMSPKVKAAKIEINGGIVYERGVMLPPLVPSKYDPWK